MASSSNLLVFVSVAILLQLRLGFTSATSTKYINDICNRVRNSTFCFKTLNSYPPAVAATNKYQAAQAVLHLGESHALKTLSFIEKVAMMRSNLKQFKACQDVYKYIAMSFHVPTSLLKEAPDSANYDIMVCYDQTTIVNNLIGKNRDVASKKVMTMTMKMDVFINLADIATTVIGW
ncbi:hypothetical protein V5N11_009936 [Cardamine amara subsp. amara]|uniref:Pectinesterase inhibitor domain-containing protein n=1 Tax=Cardamine amara subsp. amara TaxID=228776 RepID=A0ABD1AZW0_CARAN